MSFLEDHTKPKMLAAMGGLGWLGFMFAGPLGAAAGAYAGHLLGKPSAEELAVGHVKQALKARGIRGAKIEVRATGLKGKATVVSLVAHTPGGPEPFGVKILDGKVVEAIGATDW